MFGKPPWLLCVPTGDMFPVSVQWTEFFWLAQAADKLLAVEDINLAWSRLGVSSKEGREFLPFLLSGLRLHFRHFQGILLYSLYKIDIVVEKGEECEGDCIFRAFSYPSFILPLF